MNSETDINLHLEAFANAFVDKKYSDRWKHILIQKPNKAKTELVKFERQLNNSRCTLIENPDINLVKTINASTLGVYFDGLENPQIISLESAINQATFNCTDALFSITPGELAILLFHEGWSWLCKK